MPDQTANAAKSEMPVREWEDLSARIAQKVFKLSAGERTGTCFLASVGRWPDGRYMTVFVTALHVLDKLHMSSADIELRMCNGELWMSSASSTIGITRFGPPQFDCGGVVVLSDNPHFEVKDLLPLFPKESSLARGQEIGWLGFPGIGGGSLCFFHGYIAGYVGSPPAYLVDGVAVHGVSGGPVFDRRGMVVGVISAYIPNVPHPGIRLPGLSSIVPICVARYSMEDVLGFKEVPWSDVQGENKGLVR